MADVQKKIIQPNTKQEQSDKQEATKIKHQKQSDTPIERQSVKDFVNNMFSDEHLQKDIKNAKENKSADTIKPKEEQISQNTDIQKVYEFTTKKTMSLQNGKSIYKITVPEGLSICDARGNEYKVNPNGDVNISISFGYKMTLYVKDNETNKLLVDEENRPQTLVIFNTASSKPNQTITISANGDKKEQHDAAKLKISEISPMYQQEYKTENITNENKDSTINNHRIIRGQELIQDEQVENKVTITKGRAYTDQYGRTFNQYNVSLPDGVYVASMQGQYLKKHTNNDISIYSGYSKTLYLVDTQGKILKDENGNFKSLQVLNTNNAPTEYSISVKSNSISKNSEESVDTKTNAETKNEVKENEETVLENGLVTLKDKMEVRDVSQVRYVNYGYGSYPQRINVKKNIKVTNADIATPENGRIYFPSSENDVKRTSNGNIVSLNLSKPTTFAVTVDGVIKNVYLLDPADKSITDITKDEKGIKVYNEYISRQLTLGPSNQNASTAGDFILVDRNKDNGAVTAISVYALNYHEVLKRKDDKFYTLDNLEVNNLKLLADGTLSYSTKINVDGKTMTTLHSVSNTGTHSEKIYYATIYDAKAKVQEYTEFYNTNAYEAQQGVEKIVRNQRGINDATLLSDARTTIRNAMKDGALPLFFASFHGARNYNVGTGADSKWVKIIANACKLEGYEGPVGIQMQHCYSGVSQLEVEALKLLPAGSYIIKSQDNRLSYYQPSSSQSADGYTLNEAKNASVANGAAYFAGRVISQSNNPTSAVKMKDGTVQVFSENGYYPGSTSNRVLPNIDVNETRAIFKRSQVPDNTSEYYLRDPQVLHILRFLKHAANQCDYSNFNSI